LRAGARFPLAVPPAGPLYEGHFPGRPILPGIGLLDLALRALAAAGASPAVREIAVLRLRRLIAPGEDLDLEVKELGPGGRARLEVRRGAQIVAGGVVVLGGPSPGALPARAATARAPAHGAPARETRAGEAVAHEPRSAGGRPELDDLLPHRPPMRLILGTEQEMDGGVVCAARVPEQSPFTDRGSAPAIVALEMAAQAAAVFEALHRFRGGRGAGVRIGYLVGARDVRFALARLPAGETFFASVRLSGSAPPLSTYAFEVAAGSGVVAAGNVSTWLTTTGA